MSEIRKDCLYTQDHEWLKKTSKPKVARVGITDFAQGSLGDVTFLQLPAVGTSFKKGEVFGTLESVKAVSDLYAPVTGQIVKINDELVADPSPVNTSPFDEAWMIEIEVADENEFKTLLSPEAYESVAQ
jgi:glycine cleavage system H protein